MLPMLRLKRQCSPFRLCPHFSRPDTLAPQRERRTCLSFVPAALLLGVLTATVAPVTTCAQNAPAVAMSSASVRLRIAPTLRGPFVYWFTSVDRDMSARAVLPAPNAEGMLSLPVPPDYRQSGALLNVLDERRGLIARLLLETGGRAAADNAPAAPFGPNLLQNGDFAQDAAQWNAELSTGKASGTFAISPDAPPSGVPGKAARFSIDAIDKEAWHSQYVHYGLALTEGQPYTLTFWAKAARPRPLNILASVSGADYHIIGLSQRVLLSPQWRKYVLAFTATNTQPDNRLCFVLGDALGTIDLAGVALQQGAFARPLGDNILQNALFTNGTVHWTAMNQTAAATGSAQSLRQSLPNGVEGNVLRLQTMTAGGQPQELQFGQDGLPLEPEVLHTLSLWARADKNRRISVQTDRVDGEYYATGLDARLALTPEWRHYDLVFTPSSTGGATQRLVFSVGDVVGNVDIAGLALRQGGAMPASTPGALLLSPDAFTVAYKAVRGESGTGETRGAAQTHRSHPLIGTWQSFHKDVGLTGKEYQRYRFVFDASGKGSLQVTTLTENVDAPPKSQQNEPFRWQLIEGGPHVSIGANVYTWTIEKEDKKEDKANDKEAGRQKLTLKNYEGKTYILFRQ